MAGYEVGGTIQDVVLQVLGWALGGGLDGSINNDVTPEVVGQPGRGRWLTAKKQDKLTAGWKPGATDDALRFWRKHPGTHVEWIDIKIAGTGEGDTTIRHEDTGAFQGSLASIRDAWGGFYTGVPRYLGSGADSRLNPNSIADTRLLLSKVADYYELKHSEMKAEVDKFNRDEDSFRGSASETFLQRMQTAMVKVEDVQSKMRLWDTAFTNAYHGARLFQDALINDLNNLRAKYDGTIFNPHNFVIKALNNAGVESTFNQTRDTTYTDSYGNTHTVDLKPNEQLNASGGLTQGGINGDSGGGLITDQVGNWYTIMITIPNLPNPGPYNVFDIPSWGVIDDQIRGLWAKTVLDAFGDTITAGKQLVVDFNNASAVIIPPDMKPNPKIGNPNVGPNSNLNIPGLGGGPNLNIPPFDWGNGPNLNIPPFDWGGGPNLNMDPNGLGGNSNLNLDPNGLGGNSNLNLDPNGAGGGNLDLDGNGIPDNEEIPTGGIGGGGLDLDGDGLPDIPETADSSWATEDPTGGVGGNGLGPDGTQSLAEVPTGGVGGGGLGLDDSGLTENLAELPTGGSAGGLGLGGEDGLGLGGEDGLGLGGENGLGGVPVPTSLGQLGPSQLAKLRDSGALDDQPLTDEMRQALTEAGVPAGGNISNLGELTDEQLDALSDAGLLDDIPLSADDQQILSDAGMLTPQDLGDLSSGQLGALQEAGALDDVPLTGAMTDALAEAGMPATGGSLGDLSPQQLDALQEAGLLDDLALTPQDEQILQDAGQLGSSAANDLGDLSAGQLGALSSAGALNDVPLTGDMRDALAEAGMPASGTLGDLNAEQLGALQDAGLLDDLELTPEGQQILADAGMPAGGANNLGELTADQLGALQEAGALNGYPLTGEMTDALEAAGVPFDSGSLGDLSPEQLGALQDAGLLDDLDLSAEDQAILDEAGLGTSGGLDLGSSPTTQPTDLGDLTGGQLGQLAESGLLDDIPVTPEQLAELQADGLLGADTSGIESLGDLTPVQLQDLQRAGLLDDLDLTPGQMAELGLDDSGLGSGLGTGSGLGSSTPGSTGGSLGGLGSGLGGGIGDSLLPESLGSNTPSSAFPTAIDTTDIGGGGSLGGGGGGELGSATPLKNVSQPMSNTMGGGVGLESAGLKPVGEMAGQSNIGSLGTSMADAQAADARSAMSGMGGMPMMPPMGGMPNAGNQGGKDRERKTWLTEDEDVWGTDPDSPAAVIGRSDDDGQEAAEEPSVPGFPTPARPGPRPDYERRPGRG
ncbi:hypothetical protein [Kineosporia babensis]|uniref:Uncharacterized protein n=1 Tax=Kineosporia babensis TaxID=499548 RepID=A0A9X1NAN4_9ACTN|nr:hypothetical protein [Kineosporia babensis]MCD5310306.1 hypothetical protein [Kineosporia babensis]